MLKKKNPTPIKKTTQPTAKLTSDSEIKAL